MKLFSFKKVISFRDEQIIVADLAYNHPYEKVKGLLVVKGKDETAGYEYKVYFSSKGKLKLVVLKRKSRSVMMVSWKEEYDNEEVQKLKPNGDSFSECCRYLTTFREERKLVGKTFTFQSLNQKESISFVLRNDRWESEGQISQETRSSWLKPL